MTAAVAVRERPILFSAEMVKAILDGRKSMTRRVVSAKHQQLLSDLDLPEARNVRIVEGGITFDWLGGIASVPAPTPYGIVGDRLWVRETWRTDRAWDVSSPRHLPEFPDLGIGVRRLKVVYDADGGIEIGKFGRDGFTPGKVRQSIFMPRWASRITLEITNVRVERLQSITPQDCIAEGIEAPGLGLASVRDRIVGRYADLWDSLNAERAPWGSNPWVWVIEFKRVTS